MEVRLQSFLMLVVEKVSHFYWIGSLVGPRAGLFMAAATKKKVTDTIQNHPDS
jgi:hypothetical protein